MWIWHSWTSLNLSYICWVFNRRPFILLLSAPPHESSFIVTFHSPPVCLIHSLPLRHAFHIQTSGLPLGSSLAVLSPFASTIPFIPPSLRSAWRPIRSPYKTFSRKWLNNDWLSSSTIQHSVSLCATRSKGSILVVLYGKRNIWPLILTEHCGSERRNPLIHFAL